MRIEVRGKNVEVTEELREAVMQRFARVGKQVSSATLEVELCEEKNPRIADRMVAEATLGLKESPCGPRRRRRTCSTRSTRWPRTCAVR